MVRRANTAKLDMMETMTVMEYAGAETAREEVEEGMFGMSTLGLEDATDGNAARER